MQARQRQSGTRHGITMVESLIAISVTAIAGGALLTSLSASIQASSHSADVLVARGLAEQLMDEISATRFPNETDLRTASIYRIDFNDLDDYHNWTSTPPVDRYGMKLGTEGVVRDEERLPRNDSLSVHASELSTFTRTATVEPVTPDGTGGWQVTSSATPTRRITVRVFTTDSRSQARLLAELTRIINHVPTSP
ncbi:MAG: hypothetical protein Tsb009_09330 [Planctomycetaceae bacterium]